MGWAQVCLPWRAGAHQPLQLPYCVCKISCGKSSYKRKKPIDPMATPQRAACMKWGRVRRMVERERGTHMASMGGGRTRRRWVEEAPGRA